MLKVVTVMFADVVGSTRRAETMHPEDTRALMTDFFRAMSEEIEQEGGTVERIIGDGIMADFGVPTAHEDDPVRAVRAARAMLQRLDRWNAGRDPAHQIEIRVGINTGEVSAAGDPGQDLLVTGDPVNVAARLEQSAQPGTILVGPRTARAIRRAFQLKQLEPLALKGKRDPIDCFVVEGAFDASAGDQVRVEPPLVGREVELGTLLNAFERCRSTRAPHLMTILGEAGVGKSRLLREYVAELGDRAAVLIGRCIPYGAGVTLWPLREILEGLCGIREADPVQALRGVEALVKRTGATVAGDVRQTAAALASTIGLEAEERAALDPRTRHRETLIAWRSLLCNLAAAQPVVMIVQDIHWADELMLDVLDDLASHTSGPLQIVCPTRSEVLGRRPTWGAGVPNSMTIQLEPLSQEDSARLIDNMAGSVRLPASIKELVLERCEGNPFFVEEVMHQLMDEGAVALDGSQESSPAGLEIPDNVQGVLLARLDLLSPAERSIAQLAAVIGRTFWQGALESVSGSTGLPQILRELERRNFITERTGTSIAGEVEYAFNHALIRDVAYQTMPRRLRGATHDAVARWIERTSGERVDELAELMAHHLDQAHDLAPSDEIRSRARAFSLLSSRNALRRFAIRQAQDFGKRAIELSLPGSERVEALESYGDLSLVAYEIDEAWGAYKEAVDESVVLQDGSLVARLAAKAAIAATRYEGALKTLPPTEEVQTVIALGLQNAGEGDQRALCLLLASPAFSLRLAGTTAVPHETAPERAMELAERMNDPELLSVALDAAAFAVAPEARYGEMYRLQTRRVKLVPLLRDVTEACDSLGSACWAAYLAGHYEETIHFADQCLERAEGLDAGNYEHALQWRLVARFALGDWDGSLEDQALLESMLQGEGGSQIPVFLGTAFSYALLCHELRGDGARTQHYLRLLQGLKDEIGDEMGLPRAPTAMALLHQGHVAEAKSWLTLDDMAMSVGPMLEAMCTLAPDEGDDEAAWELAKIVRNDLKRMESPNLAAHVDRLEGRLLAAVGRYDDALLRLKSSVAGFSALKVVWEESYSRLLVGDLHLLNGRKADAERELQQSLRSFTELGSVIERERAATALALL